MGKPYLTSKTITFKHAMVLSGTEQKAKQISELEKLTFISIVKLLQLFSVH